VTLGKGQDAADLKSSEVLAPLFDHHLQHAALLVVGRRAGSIVAARMPFHDGQYHLGQLGAGTALSNALDIDSCPFKDQKNLVAIGSGST